MPMICVPPGSKARIRSVSPPVPRRRRRWCKACWTACAGSRRWTCPHWTAWPRTCGSSCRPKWPDAKEKAMGVPLRQVARVGAYVVRQHLKGNKRYPLVLMLEPLFRCNLACAGCGKIDYPAPILNQRISVADALQAVDECGAPVVSIAGGEPLLHKEIAQIVEGILARKKFVYLCTNALLLEKKLDQFKPHPYFSFDVHLDGDRAMHDKAVDQEGVFDRATAAIRRVKEAGFRISINCTLFD